RGTNLQQALRKASDSKLPLLGVVLFSDGQHNVDAPLLDSANVLGKQRVPIFLVGIGSRDPPRDLMILDVNVKNKAVKDTNGPIEIVCKAANLPPQEFTVEMLIDGKPARPEHRHIITHERNATYPVKFEAKMDEVGTRKLTIKATSQAGKEITLANNVA